MLLPEIEGNIIVIRLFKLNERFLVWTKISRLGNVLAPYLTGQIVYISIVVSKLMGPADQIWPRLSPQMNNDAYNINIIVFSRFIINIELWKHDGLRIY